MPPFHSSGTRKYGLAALLCCELPHVGPNCHRPWRLCCRRSLLLHRAGNHWNPSLPTIRKTRVADVISPDFTICSGTSPLPKAIFLPPRPPTSRKEIRKNLVDRNPENLEWQLDLSVSHMKLGDIAARTWRDLPAALKTRRTSLEILKNTARALDQSFT